MKYFNINYLLTVFFLSCFTITANYPDQHYVIKTDELFFSIEESSNIRISDDGRSIILSDEAIEGYFILLPDEAEDFFDRGLPSWNGKAAANRSSFKVQMRFPSGNSWSPWLTVGFWKDNLWSTYGTTNYSGGFIDYDYVKLNSYKKKWQFKVILKRQTISDESPGIQQLSFFVSDSRTTSDLNLTDILNDKPDQIIIPTTHVYQYAVDDQIGGSICSPSTVSMILMSYDIDVNVYQFAVDTYDPYYRIFGIWPRVVQNASEYGVEGTVTRYRTWSQTRDVLASGGRIAMSIGPPLYSGHLVMLAGFTSNGSPIVHDPAKSNGYGIVYNKTDISKSWFEKGGVAYTFYLPDDPTSVVQNSTLEDKPSDYSLEQNYPNPFNPTTLIEYTIPANTKDIIAEQRVTLKVFDMLGREIQTLVNRYHEPGNYSVEFNSNSAGRSLSSGVYFYVLSTENHSISKKMTLIK